MVSHIPREFRGHREHGSRDIMVLVCHIISQDRMTKVSSNIIGKSPSRIVTILPSLVVISTVVHNDFNLSPDLSRPPDQRLIRLYGRTPIKGNYHSAKCGGDRHSGSGDKKYFSLSRDLG